MSTWVIRAQYFTVLSSGHSPVTSTAFHKLSFSSLSIAQKGYVYVWVSNENSTNIPVYFDDLKISHTKSNILQEDHYYPFGMNMHGLSSSASMAKPNNYKFNGGTELTKDFGWQMYDTPFRSYDAQLGRFHQVDPLADQAPGINPYRFGFNNPISLNDPTGLYEGNIQNIFDEAWARTPGDVGFFHFDNGKLDRDLWAEGGINYVLDFVTSGEGTAEFMMDSGGGGYWLYYNPTFVGGYIGYNNEHVGSIIQKRPLYFKTSSQNGESEFNWGIPLGLAGTATSAGIEYTENMVRTAFKTGRNPVSWSKLTPSQQAWRTTNVLGKNAKYVKYAKVAGVIGTGISVGVAMNDIVQGEGTTIDYFDVGIGGASIGAAIFLASNPVGWVIGAGAAIYFAGRLVYDIYEEVND